MRKPKRMLQRRGGGYFRPEEGLRPRELILSQKICEMIPQQFTPLLNPYDDDEQLDPPILIELIPCAMEKQQCLELAPAAKTPVRPIKRPRTDMNQAPIDVLVLEREKNLLQIEVLNLQKELLQIQKQKLLQGNKCPLSKEC
ncbi:hypothetical protein J4Q44_G00318440 [Coregonus suidteri]|uniref:Uncharacterized protein n=1 Tax=Coregonus suidteri TaxID=861788 RepID=A0AAN8QFP3_9TELE